MPLRSDLGDISRVLGGLSMNGPVGRVPRRLEINAQSRRSLVGYAASPGETTGLSGHFTTPGAKPRPLTAPDAPFTANTGKPRLKLVVVND